MPAIPPSEPPTTTILSKSGVDYGTGLCRWTVVLLRDQARRWSRGHRRPVEAYLAGYPALVSQAEVGSALAASEYLLREGLGESPRLDQYVDRFPQWAHRLSSDIDFFRRHGLGNTPAVESTPAEAAHTPWYGAGSSLPEVPGYEVLSEIGRGGMAAVYLARQHGLKRLVALKFLLAGSRASEPDRLRLRQEAEAVARLTHPHVVQIHAIGEHLGCLFLSLEYVEGGSLDRKLHQHPLMASVAARMLRDLAGALHAAHSAGIIHRDLKPANVLLSRDGIAKITDFGLAKPTDGGLHLTSPGTVAGTPSYMAPEQVWGEIDRIGPATDVYGLGGILYESLTGRPPFDSPTSLETMRQVTVEEVAPVRQLQPSVPADLETICLKCLDKDPARRYQSALALAEELDRFLAGEPILAQPSGIVSRARRLARRNPLVPVMASILLLTFLAVAGMTGWSTYHAHQVVGQLRERELYLHGLRGSLLQASEARARTVELAAATGDVDWVVAHGDAVARATRYQGEAAVRAPEAVETAGLIEAAQLLVQTEAAIMHHLQAGQRDQAWQAVNGAEYRTVRADYHAAIVRFADRVDWTADEELRQVQRETYGSLALALMGGGVLAITLVVVWLSFRVPRRLA